MASRSTSNGKKLVAFIVLLALLALVWSRCSSDKSKPSPSDEENLTAEQTTTTVTVAPQIGTSSELWDLFFAGELPLNEVVELFNDPQNSTLSQEDFMAATSLAGQVLVSDATGEGRDRWPEYFLPSAPALPETTPPLLCDSVDVHAANAQKGDVPDTAQVLLVWTGSCPTDKVISEQSPASTIVSLEHSKAGWVPVRTMDDQPSTIQAVDAGTGNKQFPVQGTCSFTNDFERTVPISSFSQDGKSFHGAIDIQAEATSKVTAIERGVIGTVGWTPIDGSYISLLGTSGSTWVYASLSSVDQSVYEGLHVETGAMLGVVGTSPSEQGGTHLHFVQLDSPAAALPTNPFTLLSQLASKDSLPCTVTGS